MADDRSGFWSTLPGLLTGLAAVITAVGGIYFALNQSQAPVAAPSVSTPQPVLVGEPKQADPVPAETRATVVDPDGWTNLRSAPSMSSAAIGRVDEGEIFWVRPQDGKWWPVRMAGGQTGYIHRSRIRLNP